MAEVRLFVCLFVAEVPGFRSVSESTHSLQFTQNYSTGYVVIVSCTIWPLFSAQGNCKYGTTGIEGFSKLVMKLRAAFQESAYLLTAAVSASIDKIDVCK